MDTEGKRIRVNGELLPKHRGELVTIVGQVQDKSSDPVTITSTDSIVVSIHKSPLAKEGRFDSQWAEVTGRVAADGSIEEMFSIPINSPVDSEAWNQLVKIVDKYDGKIF